MNISAVVLNWRRPDDTIRCVRSIHETAPDVRVIVVDNGSGDGSVEQMRASLNDVTFVCNEENLGYAGGNNAGIRRALEDDRCDAVLLLNNDVVVRPGCIEALAAHLEQDVGVVAPVSLRADDPGICDFWRAEVDVSSLSVRAYGRDEPWVPPSEPMDTDYATGSAMLVGHAFREHGLFDERFFLVWEDVDFCLRLKEKADRMLVVPDAEVLHAGSSSFGGAGSPLYRYFFTRNSFLLLDKHLRWPRRNRVKAAVERRYRLGIEREHDPLVRAALERGLADGLAGRFGPQPDDLLL